MITELFITSLSLYLFSCLFLMTFIDYQRVIQIYLVIRILVTFRDFEICCVYESFVFVFSLTFL